MHSRLLQDEAGQILEAESISAGLDYPGLGPEHAHLAATGRAEYSMASDAEVLDAFRLLSHTEGIIPPRVGPRRAWVAGAPARMRCRRVHGSRDTVGRGDKTWRRCARSSVAATMPELEKELRAARERGRKLLIPYLMGA